MLEINQSAFAENLVALFEISAIANDNFTEFRVLIDNLMWLSAMPRPDIVNTLRVFARNTLNLGP